MALWSPADAEAEAAGGAAGAVAETGADGAVDEPAWCEPDLPPEQAARASVARPAAPVTAIRRANAREGNMRVETWVETDMPKGSCVLEE
ncbi:hypothetical protein GCM10010430_32580 [Kitasatospora cystarginea]|uniref:Uncharacterized protein n=1 Tax=Kitasatospora cystarginea TaxID=58350 RepID=A0ABN3E3U6_9ACTN